MRNTACPKCNSCPCECGPELRLTPADHKWLRSMNISAHKIPSQVPSVISTMLEYTLAKMNNTEANLLYVLGAEFIIREHLVSPKDKFHTPDQHEVNAIVMLIEDFGYRYDTLGVRNA